MLPCPLSSFIVVRCKENHMSEPLGDILHPTHPAEIPQDLIALATQSPGKLRLAEEREHRKTDFRVKPSSVTNWVTRESGSPSLILSS